MANEIMSVEGQLVGMPLAGPESFSQQQLDYLKRALGVDETVLWSSPDGSSTTATSCTLSEAWTNFDHIDIWYKSTDGRIERASLNSGAPVTTFMLLSQNYNGTNWWMRPTRYTISDTVITADHGAQYTFTPNAVSRSNTTVSNYLYKIVGVGRKESA